MHGIQTRVVRSIALGLALTVGVVTTSVLVASPAQAATRYEFTSDPFTIIRDGTRYRVEIFVSTVGAHPSIHITFSQVKNPDGVVRATRAATYVHQVGFSMDPTLSDGALRRREAGMGGRGAIATTWSPAGPAETSCSGDVTTRAGSFTGTFRFETHTPRLGTLTLDELPGTVTRGLCSSPNFDCPEPGFTITAGGATTLFATRTESVAGFRTFFFGSIGQEWYLHQSVESRVPLDKVTLSSNERAGTVRGARGSWFAGTGTFASDTASEPGQDQLCEGPEPYWWHAEGNDGTFSGDFEARPLLGPKQTFEGTAHVARIQVLMP